MNREDFQTLSDLLKKRSGLAIGRDKEYLMESRLAQVASEEGCKDAGELARKIRKGGVRDRVLVKITEAMTTNETFFFRDQKPFDAFRDSVLPELLKSRADQKRLRIWSAACSNGQEPYSIAMLLKDNAPKLSGWKVDLVATDISGEMVESAKRGEYSQFEVQRGLPVSYLAKHFKRKGDRWEVADDLKRMVSFRKHNLLDGTRGLGTFDVVFCRNVLIYFDGPTKRKALKSVRDAMPDDGFLFLGGAETVMGVTDAFKPWDKAKGVYRPAPAKR